MKCVRNQLLILKILMLSLDFTNILKYLKKMDLLNIILQLIVKHFVLFVDESFHNTLKSKELILNQQLLFITQTELQKHKEIYTLKYLTLMIIDLES